MSGERFLSEYFLPPQKYRWSANDLRREARYIFFKAYPRMKGKIVEVHHRIPLEWREKFPLADPNRLSNLQGLYTKDHLYKASQLWDSFRNTYIRLKRDPNPPEILGFANIVDRSLTYPRFLEYQHPEDNEAQKYTWSAHDFNLETQNIFSHRKEYEYGYYPLCWAIQLGPPRSNQKFFQIKKADRDEEEAKQARMQIYWRQFRDPDFDPKQYHVHHSVPLFLGGEDNLRTNAIILPKGIHLKGHQVLRTQRQMQFPPRPLRPLPADLYQHPIGTKYVLVDFKEKADEICYGHSIV